MMALTDPVSVYLAPSNAEAQLLCQLLVNAGIEAFVIEDMSPGGMFFLGTLGVIHRPEIWVERSASTQARSFITEFERRQSGSAERSHTEPFCYHCGEIVERGDSVCGSCGETVEDSDDEPSRKDGEFQDEQHLEESDNENTPSSFMKLRTIKKPIALCYLVVLAFFGLPIMMMVIRWLFDLCGVS